MRVPSLSYWPAPDCRVCAWVGRWECSGLLQLGSYPALVVLVLGCHQQLGTAFQGALGRTQKDQPGVARATEPPSTFCPGGLRKGVLGDPSSSHTFFLGEHNFQPGKSFRDRRDRAFPAAETLSQPPMSFLSLHQGQLCHSGVTSCLKEVPLYQEKPSYTECPCLSSQAPTVTWYPHIPAGQRPICS